MYPHPAFPLFLELILLQLAISPAQDQPAPDPLIPLVESKKSEDKSLQQPRVTAAAQLAADMAGCTASSTTVQQIQQGGRGTDTTIVL